MIKTLIATGFSCLAIGSIIGYAISELTRQPVAIAQTAPGSVVTSTPAKPKLNRQELEDRYIKAVNAFNFRVDKADLISLTDDQLNNEVYRLESLLRAGKAYTKP
ncbi:MAG: hypothetical protein IM597_12425 [Pseudanabaena sp. M176S2SP2A07QC]|nr:hypothetical protein [Pseudanabaena sp. M176S2SP2A07QC]MCA6547805.1 hypothetical protein [Pseudanabaena sp. M152S2SP2A07QC]MCA6567074.1 hypothetical protein [Pseudanabaena sp. M151S2SP2A07QC]MCA6622035.1 hypothetical protein [Pseudanabaena sp. M165S2SP1A06QC]